MTAYPSYSVAIRTLGKSGELFARLIRSLQTQTIAPQSIFVYIADGYPLPSRVADEQYIYCPKGMVSQRALPFNEIDSDFILFCDDDVEFGDDSVERLMEALVGEDGDCISPNTFPNHTWSFREKLGQAFFHGILPTHSRKYAFRIRRNARYSYCVNPRVVMRSQSCAGPVILVKKSIYQRLHFEDEIWMDTFSYALGEDQLFSYKLFIMGFSLLVHFKSGVVHNDGRTSRITHEDQSDYTERLLRYVIWYRSIYQRDTARMLKIIDSLSFYCDWLWMLLVAIMELIRKHKSYKVKNHFTSLKAAKKYVHTYKFESIPQWNENT